MKSYVYKIIVKSKNNFNSSLKLIGMEKMLIFLSENSSNFLLYITRDNKIGPLKL